MILGDTEEMGDLCCQYSDIVNPHSRPPLTERVLNSGPCVGVCRPICLPYMEWAEPRRFGYLKGSGYVLIYRPKRD